MNSSNTRVVLRDITLHYANKVGNKRLKPKIKKYLVESPVNKNNDASNNNDNIYDDFVEEHDKYMIAIMNDSFRFSRLNEFSDLCQDIALDSDIVVEPLLPLNDDYSRKTIDEAYKIYHFSMPYPDYNYTDDPIMVTEFSNDIFDYMRNLELKYRPNPNYMKFQNYLDWQYRSTLIDWIVEVHQKLVLLPETLFLTVNLIDRFLSKKIITLNRFRLVGVTALLIAAKMEEINTPSLDSMINASEEQYSRNEIIVAERFMLFSLDFKLGWPGPMSFLRKLNKADDYDHIIRSHAKYFLETTIMEPQLVSAPPSWLAAGAYYLSRIIITGDKTWSLKYAFYSGYTKEQLIPLIQLIIQNCDSAQIMHKTVWDKYSLKQNSFVVQFYEEWRMF